MNNPAIASLSPNASELIVFFHGLGSDGHDLLSLVPFLQQEFPSTYFFSPHGIEQYDEGAFGRQWFSLQDRSEETVKNLINRNIRDIWEIVHKKQQKLSLTNAQTTLVGFSQGGVIANYLALIQKDPFKAAISLSSYLVLPDEIQNKNTSFCIIHGVDDQIVDVKCSLLMEQKLKNENIKCIRTEINNLAHSIDSRVINVMVDFLQHQISNI